MNNKLSTLLLATLGFSSQVPSNACTGITLKSKDGATIAARTIEWAESVMNTMYVVVPRNQELQSLTPSGMNGLKFKTKHGFVGLSVEQKEVYEEYEGYTIIKMYAKMSSEVGINIRKGPGEAYERVAGLTKDEAITVIGQCKETGWYMVLCSEGIGFVSNEYLSEKAENDKLVLGDECPRYLYEKTEYQGQVGWFYRSDIGWQCENYEQVMEEIVSEGYVVEHFPVYVGTWRDVGDVMWIGYSKE